MHNDTANKDSKHGTVSAHNTAPAAPIETPKQRNARIKSEIAAIDVQIANLQAEKAAKRQQLTVV